MSRSEIDPRKVAVIGAGPAGLVAAKTLLQNGFKNLTIFDRRDKLGGSWYHGYPSLCTQGTKDIFEFSDLRMPSQWARHPTWVQVHEYLTAFAREHGVLEKLETSCEVINMVKEEDDRWKVIYKRIKKPNLTQMVPVEDYKNQDGTIEEKIFDYVVIANGIYHRPKMPQIPMDEYEGEIIHAADYWEEEQTKGKRVTVVGGGRSGVDIAEEIAELNGKVDLIIASPRWMLPRYFAGFIPFTILASPLFNLLPPNYGYEMSWIETIVYYITKLIAIPTFFILELILIFQQRVNKYDLKPEWHLIDQAGCFNMNQPPNFFEHVDKKRIIPHKSHVARLDKTGCVLEDNTHVESDVILMCTGYYLDYSFIEPKYRSMIINDAGKRAYLYRNVVHPEVPNLFFIGMSCSFNGLIVREMPCHWVAGLLKRKFVLPPRSKMYQWIENFKQWKEDMDKWDSNPSICLDPEEYFYFKLLLQDLGIEKKLTGGMYITEYFNPTRAEHYTFIPKSL